VRCRSNYPFLEQPRRQGGRPAGQYRAAARIGPGAVRDDGAITLQDPDVVDPGAEFVRNDLRQRGSVGEVTRNHMSSAGSTATV